MPDAPPLRWRLADDDAGQPALFGDEVPGQRELRTVEYLHVRARRVISAVPNAARSSAKTRAAGSLWATSRIHSTGPGTV